MAPTTRVLALYIHGDRSCRPEDTEATPMLAMPSADVVEGQGIRQDARYFRTWEVGRERKRQVSLIDEGTIWRHEAQFGTIDRSLIKAQLILEGEVFLPGLVGARLVFDGGAEFEVALERKPCFAMDLIAPGLREAMQNGRQGALAKVTRSGPLWIGQQVSIEALSSVAQSAG